MCLFALPLAIDGFVKDSIQNSVIEIAMAIDQVKCRTSRKAKEVQVAGHAQDYICEHYSCQSRTDCPQGPTSPFVTYHG